MTWIIWCLLLYILFLLFFLLILFYLTFKFSHVYHYYIYNYLSHSWYLFLIDNHKNYNYGYQLVKSQLIKSLMVELEIWGSIRVYTKNWLVSWSDDKELSSGADVIGWNSISKMKIKIKTTTSGGTYKVIKKKWNQIKCQLVTVI